jgi:3'-5' exoribonuclease
MCDRIDGFPPGLRMLLSHLMLSHQGHKEFSSPVEPMIPEGFVLYFADEMDSKLNAVGRIVGKAREENRTWSDYVRIINRFIYIDGNGEVDSDN